MIYDIDPVAKPRMTRRDKWNPSKQALKYFAFKDECRLKKVEVPESFSHVTFIVRMPKSWTKKKMREYDGKAHQQVPDVDNFAKAILDAVYGDDSCVWDIRISKLWGYTGQIIVEQMDY